MQQNMTQTAGAIPGVFTGQVVAPPIKYCLYARKSTEQDELQALSIDSQIKEMMEMAQRDGLNVVEIRRESHSAKDSGQRPIFGQLLADVRAGLFNGILAWAPDRLSRNAGDLGSVVDLMDQKLLHEIRTYGQKFSNSPNEKFLLMILCSQAKLENDNKGVNVKRGMRAKCEKGWRPGPPPLGYIHDRFADKGDKKVFLDPKRAPFIKQIFEKVAYEQWSGRKILKWIRGETSFTTKKGKQVPLSMIYRMLGDTFYYGIFEYPQNSGKWYEGKHDPIISKQLFEKTREHLSRDNIERSECKEFAFTKLMKCGLCGAGITAQEKLKKLSDGTVKKYVYYGCTRGRDLYCKCGYLREDELINQLIKIVDEMSVDDLGVKGQLEAEIERYSKFSRSVLGMNEQVNNQKEVSMKRYVKYVLKEGSIQEKREILSNFKSQIIMENKEIRLAGII